VRMYSPVSKITMLKKFAKILARLILLIWVSIWFIYLSSELVSPRETYIQLGLLTIPVVALTFLLIYYGRDREA
jgi:hypothetical protein